MRLNYAELFNTLQPGFFEDESIRSLPREYVFEEQILFLHDYDPSLVQLTVPEGITFGLYTGDLDKLRAAVRLVDDDWPQYFNEGDRFYCAFHGDEIVSFCNVDEFGEYNRLRVAGPGCVGTLPAWRRKGIGLKMVQEATVLLQKEGYDLSYIHYTHVGHWYARLGYRTILHWNAGGIISQEL